MAMGGGCHGDGAGDEAAEKLMEEEGWERSPPPPFWGCGGHRLPWARHWVPAGPRAGERCELSARGGRCTPGVCRNGGTCLNLLVGGFRCQCPPGHYEKPFCTMSTRSFPPRSFLTFRGLRQRFHFTLALT